MSALLDDLREGRSVGVYPLSQMLNLAPSTIYRGIERGEIQATRVGTVLRVPAHEGRRLLQLPEPTVLSEGT